jgi:hypothetical protein
MLCCVYSASRCISTLSLASLLKKLFLVHMLRIHVNNVTLRCQSFCRSKLTVGVMFPAARLGSETRLLYEGHSQRNDQSHISRRIYAGNRSCSQLCCSSVTSSVTLYTIISASHTKYHQADIDTKGLCILITCRMQFTS